MSYKLIIEKVENGFVTKSEDPEATYVYQDDEGKPLEHVLYLLYDVLEHFGYYGSKHDAERIRIEIIKQHENEETES